MRKMIAFMFLVGTFISCHAESFYTPGGFKNGNDYMQLTKSERISYLQGLFDGYMFAPFVAASNKTMAPQMHDCSMRINLNVGQLTAIVDKYMNENPERWGTGMNMLAYNAIILACRKNGIPLGLPNA